MIKRAIVVEAKRWLFDTNFSERSETSASMADHLARAIVDAFDRVTEFPGVRDQPRDRRQETIAIWAAKAFGQIEATSLPQRGLRLLEEAVEAFQACGGAEAKAHELVTFVFARPPGGIGQELGGVAVTTLALAAAAGLSADEEESREIYRVLGKPLREFTERNAAKNAAGFLVAESPARRCPWGGCPDPDTCDSAKHLSPHVCGDFGVRVTTMQHGIISRHCKTCGKELP